MTRVRISTTVDETLLADVRALRSGARDSEIVDDAFSALLLQSRSAQIDLSYAAYDEVPLSAPDAWGDLASFREAAGR
ncbi:antitoxin MazE5 [Luteipulveratus sp. YIM 133132]|uniref:antitoxin MazE5 n=1 Tax=Luteipulveratus flavus TaxID=3031728 RepID=UPI0023AF6DC6|nr:antitoxin MazE5 [Luteipulveratus sp. YIM 133132]MDE9367649.1 antitoxin MazE5 [Luteipulveratus sp. YIM 133132]